MFRLLSFFLLIFLAAGLFCTACVSSENKGGTLVFVAMKEYQPAGTELKEDMLEKHEVTLQKNRRIVFGIPWQNRQRIIGRKLRYPAYSGKVLHWEDIGISDRTFEKIGKN